MVKVFVNNIEVCVEPNTSVLKACEALQIEIPRFCYHKKLSIAGNCRMCLVEIEKSPKPVVSCAMPVMEGMKIFTDTPLVKKAREGVLEFLLLNHPLDCPICDQGGECDLQDQAMVFGSDSSRFYDLKRGVHDKKLGPLIKTIMTRCIHCTRCIRFATEVAGVEDLGTVVRGTDTEIGTYIEKIFKSELSGNVIDLCPVGALTSKPYAFKARPWELKTEISVDTSDGLGSDIKIDFKSNEIVRVTPHFVNHLEFNANSKYGYSISKDNYPFTDEWISDKARFSYDGFQSCDMNVNSICSIGSLLHSLTKQSNISYNDDYEKVVSKRYFLDNFNSSIFDTRVGVYDKVFLSGPLSMNAVDYLRNNDPILLNKHSDYKKVMVDKKKKIKTNDFTFFVTNDTDYQTLIALKLMVDQVTSELLNCRIQHFKKVCFNRINIRTLGNDTKIPNLKIVSMEESFFNMPENQLHALSPMSRQKTNVSIANLEHADLCLLIGTNPRYEGSLYNVHLRKRLLKGGFKIALIGAPVDLTYPISHLGLGTQTLRDLAEGKNSFFKELLKAKTPMILLGSVLLHKKDYSLIENLSLHLALKTGVIPKLGTANKSWFGFGFLQAHINKLGQIALQIFPLNSVNFNDEVFNINFLLSDDVAYLDMLSRKLNGKNSRLLFSLFLKSYLEKNNSSFLTTEGKLKKVNKLVRFSKVSKSPLDHLEFILFMRNFIISSYKVNYLHTYSSLSQFKIKNSVTSPFSSTEILRLENLIENHYLTEFPAGLVKEGQVKTSKDINKIDLNYNCTSNSSNNSVFNSLFEDFYLTDSTRRLSFRMLRCSALHRLRTTNFFKESFSGL